MDLTPDTPVKIVSTDDRTFTFEYRNAEYGAPDRYRLNPNETIFWPWKVACYFLGDPQLIDRPDDQRGGREMTRIMRKAGVFNLSFEEFTEARPKVECFAMDGSRLTMKQEVNPNEEYLTAPITPENLEARMAALQAEIDLLRANAAGPPLPAVTTEIDTAAAADPEVTATSLDEIPTDTALPTPRRSGAPRPAPLRPTTDAAS